jgi:hypothetical protein
VVTVASHSPSRATRLPATWTSFIMDYEYQENKKEIHQLKYIVFEIYILSIRINKLLKYFLSVNTNSGDRIIVNSVQ